jgi:hypothetical protein
VVPGPAARAPRNSRGWRAPLLAYRLSRGAVARTITPTTSPTRRARRGEAPKTAAASAAAVPRTMALVMLPPFPRGDPREKPQTPLVPRPRGNPSGAKRPPRPLRPSTPGSGGHPSSNLTHVSRLEKPPSSRDRPQRGPEETGAQKEGSKLPRAPEKEKNPQSGVLPFPRALSGAVRELRPLSLPHEVTKKPLADVHLQPVTSSPSKEGGFPLRRRRRPSPGA